MDIRILTLVSKCGDNWQQTRMQTACSLIPHGFRSTLPKINIFSQFVIIR